MQWKTNQLLPSGLMNPALRYYMSLLSSDWPPFRLQNYSKGTGPVMPNILLHQATMSTFVHLTINTRSTHWFKSEDSKEYIKFRNCTTINLISSQSSNYAALAEFLSYQNSVIIFLLKDNYIHQRPWGITWVQRLCTLASSQSNDPQHNLPNKSRLVSRPTPSNDVQKK